MEQSPGTSYETIRNDMSYTLGAAAKATGKSKTTIQRAIKSGRLSATRNDAGFYTIDPSELHRVFPPVSSNRSLHPDTEQSVPPSETVLRRELEALREERERERQQLQAMISDVQQERDHWRQQATYLLESKHERRKASWFTQLWRRTP